MRALQDTLSSRLTATLFLALVGSVGCGADTASANGNRGPGGGPGGRPGGANVITPVEVTTVGRANIARNSVVTGQLSPLRVVGVTSQASGALLRVLVEEGTEVRAGALLAELDASELRSQIRAAEANVAFARATSERSTAMFEQRIVTAAEYERDRAALASAEATLAQLMTRLGFARVTAPISGVVMQRFVQAGDIVGGQSRLFTIADVGTLVTQLPVSELEVPLLKVGAEVPVSVDALGRTVPGTIRRIFPAADSTNRLVPVEVAVTGGTQSGLRPGYTVRVTLRLDERVGALVIPTRAIIGAAGAQSVYVVQDGRAERRRVRVGQDLDGRTEVIEGLAFGDTIVTTGSALLRDGAAVRIVEPLSPEAPALPRPIGAPAGARP